MGFERNYQIKILSNQINTLRRSYTSISKNLLYNLSNNLNPWYLTGFSDAESNFTVRIIKSNSVKVGWTVQLVFQIGLHKKDINLLEKIQAFWGVGEIYHKEQSSNYVVQSLRGLNVIVNHFEKYPLLTKKCEDFKLFAQIMTLMNKKEHLTQEGFNKIEALSQQMNKKRTNFNVPLAPR